MLQMLSVTFISLQSRSKRVSLLVGGLSSFIMFTGGEVRTWLATWGKLKNLILTAGMIYQQRGGGLPLFFFYSFFHVWIFLRHPPLHCSTFPSFNPLYWNSAVLLAPDRFSLTPSNLLFSLTSIFLVVSQPAKATALQHLSAKPLILTVI